MSDALNPNHPVTREMSDQWHKLCALVMHKAGMVECKIRAYDMERLSASNRANIVVESAGDTITLRLVGDQEAARLAREEGGLPV